MRKSRMSGSVEGLVSQGTCLLDRVNVTATGIFQKSLAKPLALCYSKDTHRATAFYLYLNAGTGKKEITGALFPGDFLFAKGLAIYETVPPFAVTH